MEFTNIKRNKTKRHVNVIEAVSQKILAWQKLSSPQKGIEITINSLTSQTNLWRSSDHATLTLTVRFDDKTKSDELDEQIRRIAEKGTNGKLLVRIREEERRLPVMPNKANLDFYEKVHKLARILEVRVEPIHRNFSSDICHVPETVPVLGGFGPIGGDIQMPNEFILRDSLIDRAALLALVINTCGK